jgi:predicted nucleotidyltransferase
MDQVSDSAQLIRLKREEILNIAAKHGARSVRVFGSVARGEALFTIISAWTWQGFWK